MPCSRASASAALTRRLPTRRSFEHLGHFSMGKDQGAIALLIGGNRQLSVNREFITAFRRIVSNIAHVGHNLSRESGRYSIAACRLLRNELWSLSGDEGTGAARREGRIV